MNKTAFTIYKLLKQFDVSSEEMDGLAEGYKKWLKNQTSALAYRVVYFMNGELVALPCHIRKLRKYEVGLEIDGTCFFKKHSEVIQFQDVSTTMKSLQTEIFGDAVIPDDICLRLPTEREIGNLIEKTKDTLPWVSQTYCKYGTYWITPIRKDRSEVVAEVGYSAIRTHQLVSNYTACTVRPVCYLLQDDFIGNLNKYGMPDEATAEKISQMLASRKK